MQKQNVVLPNLVPKDPDMIPKDHILIPKDLDETRLHFVVLSQLNPERLRRNRTTLLS